MFGAFGWMLLVEVVGVTAALLQEVSLAVVLNAASHWFSDQHSDQSHGFIRKYIIANALSLSLSLIY